MHITFHTLFTAYSPVSYHDACEGSRPLQGLGYTDYRWRTVAFCRIVARSRDQTLTAACTITGGVVRSNISLSDPPISNVLLSRITLHAFTRSCHRHTRRVFTFGASGPPHVLSHYRLGSIISQLLLLTAVPFLGLLRGVGVVG